jgi:DHA1 family tetracycline resistance protein-like MFS transporter
MNEMVKGPAGRRAGFGFIFALSLMNSISFGIMIPILPNLVKQFTGGDTAAAAEWSLVFAVTWGLLQFFCGPILGLMSDRWGRRPVLLLSLFGLAVDFLFMAFAPTLMWLFVGRILNGMTAASFSTANAYLADVTPPDQRAKIFGWMSSSFSVGFIFGPWIGGHLGAIDLRLPFMVAAGLTFVAWLYGLFVLPESLPADRRTAKFDWKRANPVGALTLLKSHKDLVSLASIYFIFQFAHMVLPSIFVLYLGYRYNWGLDVLAWCFLATGIMGVIVQAFLVGPIVKKVGERVGALLGCVAAAAGFAIYAYAPTGMFYIVGMPIFAFSGLLIPSLQALMTKRVAPNEQGQLQGANQALMGISAIFAPIVFGETFAWSLRQAGLNQPGLAIYIAAALMVLAFILAVGFARTPEAEPQAA